MENKIDQRADIQRLALIISRYVRKNHVPDYNSLSNIDKVKYYAIAEGLLKDRLIVTRRSDGE